MSAVTYDAADHMVRDLCPIKEEMLEERSTEAEGSYAGRLQQRTPAQVQPAKLLTGVVADEIERQGIGGRGGNGRATTGTCRDVALKVQLEALEIRQQPDHINVAERTGGNDILSHGETQSLTIKSRNPRLEKGLTNNSGNVDLAMQTGIKTHLQVRGSQKKLAQRSSRRLASHSELEDT
jgi:hypothetical protein